MRALFSPQSVALIGVPRQTGVGAYNGLEMLLRYGYAGKIFVVHPKATEILGFRAYPRILEVPEVPELAVIAVGRDRVLPVFQDCLVHGIRWIIIISQGFADADAQGQELQAQLVSEARRYGARFLGPNTMGTMNAFAAFTTAFIDQVRDPNPPPVTLVAQSGAPQVGSESFTGRLGKAIDLGNAADLGFVEVLEYLEHDSETELIVLHMEGLSEGRKFLEVASRITRNKPIIVFKTGRSEAGARAALSHTGSLVGEDAVFTAAFARAGLVKVNSATELLDTVQAFRQLAPLKGPRLGVATASGALGIMAVDALTQEGLTLGRLAKTTRKMLEDKGPYWHRLQNPVDLWPIGMVSGDFIGCAETALAGFLADPEIDGVVGLLPALSSPLHQDMLTTPKMINRLGPERVGKPLVLSLYGDHREQTCQDLAQVPGVACYFAVERAVAALGKLYRYHQAIISTAESWGSARPPVPCPQMPRPVRESVLLGQAALEFLAAYDIPVLPSRLTKTDQEAVDIAEAYGYPVVLKVVSPQWLHKSDLGGVVLHLSGPDQVRQAFLRLQAAVECHTPGALLEGILVQKQLSGKEILLGIKQDATFGPVVVCGLGGIYTEILQDVAHNLAPVTVPQAQAMLLSLKAYPLLLGGRGEPPVALEELAQALANLSELAVSVTDLQELDINPVIATPAGCWAVDARIVWQKKPE
ncbi:MAG: acetate--CoA ligase family protein [Deltaproteobacteria bacterium]|nr:acetate--CoA ligase family protein [Deltaproteobacteria bacterium]MBW1951989.1 acetate--CoA ligase family protein [Deltaproteobacteria bacterium]MBW1987226.1 acetate--CoA ligase family protein [Deltaproteobacteria bacterium]MBW2134293.1 acetate--CoA ligase family protein [Deltaproteobacteria bacterium]